MNSLRSDIHDVVDICRPSDILMLGGVHYALWVHYFIISFIIL